MVLNEFSWHQNMLVQSGSTMCGVLSDITAGPGRGDGVNRLYVQASRTTYELTWRP
jgi:hypothetical protein